MAEPTLPDWIESVFPTPNGRTAFPRVQVRFQPVFTPERMVAAGDEGARLFIDDTDVTTYATLGPGHLVYDGEVRGRPAGGATATARSGGTGTGGSAPDGGGSTEGGATGNKAPDGTGVVDLGPGTHTARVERVTLNENEEHTVLDEFTWTFTVQ